MSISNLDIETYKYKSIKTEQILYVLGIFYLITVTCRWFHFKCKQQMKI